MTEDESLAAMQRWRKRQDRIRECEDCANVPRVALQIRQRTSPPKIVPARLLVVLLAPPFEPNIPPNSPYPARSVGNDPRDSRRPFFESIFGSWQTMVDQGAAVLHAVKCGIKRDEWGFQSAPDAAVDR
jgi:hypothetical protein